MGEGLAAGATLLFLLLGLGVRLVQRKGPGLGEVLQELARGRTAAAVERERRATTVEVLDRLSAGGRIEVTDERGRRAVYKVASPRAHRRHR